MKLELAKLNLPQLDALKDTLTKVLGAPERRRAVIAGAVGLFALGVWYFAIAQPMAGRVAALKARYDRAQRQLQTLQNPSGQAEAKARVTDLEARVRAALGRMSQDVQLVQILKQLSEHAARYQVVVDNIDVKAAEAGATPTTSGQRPRDGQGRTEPEQQGKPLEMRTQRLELTLYCSYEAAARFLDDLKKLPVFVIVDALKIERDAKSFPNLKVLLTLKFHSIKQLPEELTKT